MSVDCAAYSGIATHARAPPEAQTVDYARGFSADRLSERYLAHGPACFPPRRIAPIVSAQDPQRARQRGEIGQQREDKGRGGDDAELAHRRQVREHERQKAAGIDESRE